MLLQGQVGPITSTADGVQVAPRMGKLGDGIISELHPRYYEAAYRKARFNAANQTGIATTVGVATTYTGLVLSNPVGSSVNLVVGKVGVAFPVAVAAGLVYGLMVGYHASTNVTHTAASTTLRNNFVGVGSTPVGLVDTSATLPTAPTVSHVLGAVGTAAMTAPATLPPCLYDMEGDIILPPGAYCAFFTSAASGALGFMGSFSWTEVPV